MSMIVIDLICIFLKFLTCPPCERGNAKNIQYTKVLNFAINYFSHTNKSKLFQLVQLNCFSESNACGNKIG